MHFVKDIKDKSMVRIRSERPVVVGESETPHPRSRDDTEAGVLA